jgi:hypothetical protein
MSKDNQRPSRRDMLLGGAAGLAAGTLGGVQLAQAQTQAAPAAATPQGKPNILVIFGDDIGWSNISAYNMGMMGYRTPNIDRIAREGAIFTDAYGENSCTAGRSAFITGQSPLRTGTFQGGPARRARRHARGRPDHCRAVESHGLCYRTIRQEPSGRS